MKELLQPKNILFLAEAALSTAAIYCFLVAIIRVVGRRALSQLSAYDFLVVVLLGSAVETSMVQASTRLEAGFVSCGVLLLLNKALTSTMLRHPRLRHFVAGGPTVLINRGRIVEEHLIRVGLTHADLAEALREREIGDISECRLAVIEPSGVVSVVSEKDLHKSKPQDIQ